MAGLVVSALLLVGCSDDGGDEPAAEGPPPTVGLVEAGVLRLGVVGDIQLDPARAVPTDQGQMTTIDLVYDGLTATDPDTGDAVASLAASWDSAEDHTQWRFELRDDAAFSDGSPVTAGDVKASLERVAAQGTASLAGVRLDVIEGYADFVADRAEGIAGIRASDDGRTVLIDTSESFAPLPQLLSTPIFGVVPAATGELDFAAPVGSGPLAVAGSPADEAALDAGPADARRALVLEPAVGAELGIDGVTVFGFADVETSYRAFVDGEVDWSTVPPERADEAAERFGDAAMTAFHAEFFYGINIGDEKYQDRDFRRALVQAVDRQAVVDEHFPTGAALNGTVVRGVPGFQADPCGAVCAHSPSTAEELVRRAFPDGDVPEVTLDFYEGQRERAVAEAIAEDLEAVGIPTELHVVEEDYETFVTSGDQEVFLFGWVGIAPTADSYLAPLFLSGSPDNVSSFSSEAVDVGLAAARALESVEERAEAYQVVEEAVMSQVPVIPLVQVRSLAVVSGAVTGWQPQMDGTFVVERVRLGE